MVFKLILLLLSFFGYLGISFVSFLLVVNLTFNKGFLETTSWNLILEVAFFLQLLLLFGKLLGFSRLLLVTFLILKIQWLCFLNLFVSLLSLSDLKSALFCMQLDLLKSVLVLLQFFLSESLFNLLIHSGFLLLFAPIFLKSFLTTLLLEFLSHTFFLLKSLDQLLVTLCRHLWLCCLDQIKSITSFALVTLFKLIQITAW